MITTWFSYYQHVTLYCVECSVSEYLTKYSVTAC